MECIWYMLEGIDCLLKLGYTRNEKYAPGETRAETEKRERQCEREMRKARSTWQLSRKKMTCCHSLHIVCLPSKGGAAHQLLLDGLQHNYPPDTGAIEHMVIAFMKLT
eukprot:6194079-Pleurochrysis_carterae.AAC.3